MTPDKRVEEIKPAVNQSLEMPSHDAVFAEIADWLNTEPKTDDYSPISHSDDRLLVHNGQVIPQAPKTDEVERIMQDLYDTKPFLVPTAKYQKEELKYGDWLWLEKFIRTTLQTQADKAKRERELLLQSIWDAFKDQSEIGVNHLRVELEAHGININD